MDNSGLWLDFKIQSPEDQTKFALPLNRDTESLYYNTRIAIDAPVLTEPRIWLVSKISRNSPRGIVIFTVAQDIYNQFTDQAFYKENGDVDYWVADWNQTAVAPDSVAQPSTTLFSSITSEITVPGNHQIKTGSYKTFTVTFYEDDVPIEHDVGEWSVLLDGVDATDLVTITPSGNKARVKFNGGDDYIGKILRVINTSGEIVSALDVEIIAL